ncbi:MAG: [protein-PII] uridylyltransferase [Alphaproteobacteria bacterium]|nr:[protein-PII] uridylyltransferase [Alphaproteobacteria bacterium]
MTESKRQREIIDRGALAEEIATLRATARDDVGRRKVVLERLRDALEAGQAEVRRQFEAGRASGTRAGANLTFLFDQIIRIAHDVAAEEYPSANPTSADRLAIAAVGGYGRGEMAPFSDIDLLFLFPYKQTPRGEQVVEYILYLLWDLGVKVGHSTRSTNDCVRLAKQDLTIRTALLEARFLWGDQALFLDFRKTFQDRVVAGTALEFVDGKLTERDVRHKKLGDSRYLVEPNVKDGKGGLRDLQTLFWIAKYTYQVDNVSELVAHGVLSEDEARNFAKDQNFLWTVRFHLHYLAGRAEERMTFDLQTRLAKRMNYTDHAGASGVERFMKHYYLVAKDVGDLTRIFCASIEAENMRKPIIRLPRFRRPRDLMGFKLDRDRLTVSDDQMFARDPVAMIRLFHVGHQQGLDIHPHALRLMTQNLRKIGKKVRNDPEANRLFIDILTSSDEPEIALTRMNEAGVFGRFLPDFGRVVGQTQHDMYHVYTVDEHSIRAIDLLHRIETGELADDHPLSTEIIHKIQSRRALYVATFLHDIAKGRGGQHSEKGAAVALSLCPRLGLSEEETESVAWLVLHHLDMSNTAQKRDIDDPKTIADFTEAVQSPERLKLLLVLTVADMRATGPRVWNAWKAALLRDLYYRTEEVMSGEAIAGGGTAARIEGAHSRLREQLDGWPSTAVDAHLARGYPGYWLSLDTAAHARHAELIRAAEDQAEALVVDTQVDPSRAITEVTVYTSDHPGLFSRIAGAMALSGASIVDAKIYTLTNGKALDIFWVQDAEGGAFDDAGRLKRLSSRIAESLKGEIATGRELMGRESLPSRARVFAVPPRVLIDEAASATHTVIEVNGRDRPGLLYEVTRALTDLGLQISSAKISTYGERVIDVFYVKDVFGMKIQHDTKHAAIRDRLMLALVEPALPAEKQTSQEHGEAAPQGAG